MKSSEMEDGFKRGKMWLRKSRFVLGFACHWLRKVTWVLGTNEKACFPVASTLDWKCFLLIWYLFSFLMLFSSVPALFLVDAVHVMYLWHGWWPSGDDSESRASTTGSAETRWSNDRRLAMETIKSYATGITWCYTYYPFYLKKGRRTSTSAARGALYYLYSIIVLCWKVFQRSCSLK